MVTTNATPRLEIYPYKGWIISQPIFKNDLRGTSTYNTLSSIGDTNSHR